MNATEPDERSSRVLALAQGMVKAAEALERNDWNTLEHISREMARQARVLGLIDRETAKEGSD